MLGVECRWAHGRNELRYPPEPTDPDPWRDYQRPRGSGERYQRQQEAAQRCADLVGSAMKAVGYNIPAGGVRPTPFRPEGMPPPPSEPPVRRKAEAAPSGEAMPENNSQSNNARSSGEERPEDNSEVHELDDTRSVSSSDRATCAFQCPATTPIPIEFPTTCPKIYKIGTSIDDEEDIEDPDQVQSSLGSANTSSGKAVVVQGAQEGQASSQTVVGTSSLSVTSSSANSSTGDGAITIIIEKSLKSEDSLLRRSIGN